ncbi:hypothetical protein, partial [Acinetobacter baumannii]
HANFEETGQMLQPTPVAKSA